MTDRYTLGYALLSFQVLGEPVPQGQIRNLGKGRPSVYANQQRLLPFREHVQHAAEQAISACVGIEFPINDGVGVTCHFTVKRAVVPGKGLSQFPAKKPDIDKLERAIFDALRPAGVYHDDKQVVWSHSTKSYPGTTVYSLLVPGVRIQVYKVTREEASYGEYLGLNSTAVAA